MTSKAIKVSENTYNNLKKISKEKRISIKEVVDRMTEDKNGIEEYKGSWKMTDKEKEEIKKERESLWENWKL